MRSLTQSQAEEGIELARLIYCAEQNKTKIFLLVSLFSLSMWPSV